MCRRTEEGVPTVGLPTENEELRSELEENVSKDSEVDEGEKEFKVLHFREFELNWLFNVTTIFQSYM